MEYKKIAERLANYKIFLGEKIPIYGINPSKCEECINCPIYRSPKGNKEEWINDLEIIVKRRHSKFELIRKLSRFK